MEVITGPAPAVPRSSHKFMQLSPIQTSFAANPSRRVRPPNPDHSAFIEPPTKLTGAVLKTPPLTHRISKGGLLALFRRKMVARNLETYEELDKPVKGEKCQSRLASRGTQVSYKSAALALDQENLSSPSRSRKLRRQSSKPGTRPRPFKRELLVKTPTAWDPPPLFQAYPQAVKHANIRAPTLSTNTLLRSNGGEKITNIGESVTQSSTMSKSANAEVNVARRNYAKRKSKHTLVEPVLKEDWTRNLYVLVTSGYFLQYSGEGSFDRLPEKIMALNKDSAAFASDVILGERWVLQVSQFYDEDGIQSSKNQGSIVKKIRFPRDTKRFASSLLLVLDSAEELDSWLRAVKGEIESMGGRKYSPDSEVSGAKEDTASKERGNLSHRYSMRSPDRYCGLRWDSKLNGSFGNVLRDNGALSPVAHLSPTSTVKRHSLASQTSADSANISNATASINQTYLDQLRGSPLLSCASTGVKTSSTSRGSSPGPSPGPAHANPSLPLPEHASSLGEGAPLVSTISTGRWGSSQNDCHASGDPSPSSRSNSRPVSRSPRRLSTRRSSLGHSTPQSATNFSVPTFAKRSSILGRVSSTSTNQAPGSPHKDLDLSKVLNNPAAELYTEVEDTVSSLPRPFSSYELSLLPPSNGRPLPRRLSSLQYSRGIQPRHLAAHDLLPPYPPPRSALPAVPSHLPLTGQDFLKSDSPQNCQLRRPLSMQVHNVPTRLVHHPLPQSEFEDNPDLDHPPEPSRDFLACLDRTALSLPLQCSKIQSRRSMPEIEVQADFSQSSSLPLPKLPQ